MELATALIIYLLSRWCFIINNNNNLIISNKNGKGKKNSEQANSGKPAKRRSNNPKGSPGSLPTTKTFKPETEEDRALATKLLTEVLTEYRKPKVKDDKELAERIDDYFRRCAQNGQVPTVEEMCLCTGYSQDTVWDWEHGRNHGFSTETSDIIKKAKHVLKTFDAKLVIAGKMNFLAYCFRAKNYYGMVDKQEYILTPQQPLGDAQTQKALEDKLSDIIESEE